MYEGITRSRIPYHRTHTSRIRWTSWGSTILPHICCEIYGVMRHMDLSSLRNYDLRTDRAIWYTRIESENRGQSRIICITWEVFSFWENGAHTGTISNTTISYRPFSVSKLLIWDSRDQVLGAIVILRSWHLRWAIIVSVDRWHPIRCRDHSSHDSSISEPRIWERSIYLDTSHEWYICYISYIIESDDRFLSIVIPVCPVVSILDILGSSENEFVSRNIKTHSRVIRWNSDSFYFYKSFCINDNNGMFSFLITVYIFSICLHCICFIDSFYLNIGIWFWYTFWSCRDWRHSSYIRF